MDNITLQDGTQLDPKIVKVMKTMKQLESGGSQDPYNAIGDQGNARGAYQFNEKTGMGWKTYAKNYLGDENAEMTPANQNKAMYSWIKEQKDKGLQPDEIDALHNGATKDLTTGKYVHNNKERAKQFTQLLGASVEQPVQNITTQQSQNVTRATETQEPTLGQDIGKGLMSSGKDLGQAGKTALEGGSDLFKGNIVGATGHLASGLIQGAGAIAGGAGNVVNALIEHTPVVGQAVKGIENLIGQGVGALAKTDAGKSVVNYISEFSKKHPELSKDIGAGFNIITAIPIFKGLGAIKNVAMDSISQALKGIAEKGANKDLVSAVSNTIKGKKALTNTPNAIKKLVDERAIPDVEQVGNKLKYTTKEASAKLDDAISAKDDILDSMLKSANVKGAKPVINIGQARNSALRSAEQSLEGTPDYESVVKKINNIFDAAENSSKAIKTGGETYLNLEDANLFKRRARSGLKWDDTVGKDAGYHVGQSYMKEIEDSAMQNGLGDVRAVNQEMKGLIEAQQMLSNIEGKPVKLGTGGELLKDVSMGLGEKVGNLTGIPITGALSARGLGGLLGKVAPKNLQASILSRTGKGAVKTTAKELGKKTAGLIGGAVTQKANK